MLCSHLSFQLFTAQQLCSLHHQLSSSELNHCSFCHLFLLAVQCSLSFWLERCLILPQCLECLNQHDQQGSALCQNVPSSCHSAGLSLAFVVTLQLAFFFPPKDRTLVLTVSKLYLCESLSLFLSLFPLLLWDVRSLSLFLFVCPSEIFVSLSTLFVSPMN